MTKNPLSEATPKVFEEQKKSNPIKGAKYRDAARKFVKRWPIGSSLTWDELCRWLFVEGLLNRLPSKEDEKDRQSNGWLAHLQLRHQARVNLNKGAQHSDMIPYGGAFSIEAVGGALMVKSVSTVIAQGDVAKKVDSLAMTKSRQLDYLYQSTDWSVLPPYERLFAEALRDDIGSFVRRISNDAEDLNQKFLKLQNRLDALVRTNQIQPTNGGITGILEDKS